MSDGVASQPSADRGLPRGQVHDIEDLGSEGRRLKACPYFAARHFAEDAELVFCPYRSA